jgi:hypothetical protein
MYFVPVLTVLMMTPAVAGVADASSASPGVCKNWVHTASPNAGTGDNNLYGVAAISARSAWAVGEYFVGVNIVTLIEHWNGKSWRKVPSPNVDTGDLLKAVYAVSATNVWAAGSYFNGTAGRTLIEHWNGKSWSVVPSPNLGSGSNEISSIRGTSARDIWAAGDAITSYPAGRTVILHWNGRRWRVAPSPSEPADANLLTSVRPLSPADAWAVGRYVPGSASKALILRWSQSHWRIVPSPDAGTGANALNGVLGRSATDAWAVGDYSEGAVDKALILHWNGRHWQIFASPGVEKGSRDLAAIGGPAAANLYAVGSSGSVTTKTLILHWDGKNWRAVPSPNPGTAGNDLSAIYAQSPASIWAVGSYTDGHFNRTLIEYCPLNGAPRRA